MKIGRGWFFALARWWVRFRPRSLLLRLAFTCLAAVLAGLVAVHFFARARPTLPAQALDRFAQFENIRMPVGARNLAVLKSFTVRFRGVVDDFGRIYVNNREVVSAGFREPLKAVIWDCSSRTAEALHTSCGELMANGGAALAEHFHLDRAISPSTEAEVKRWLRVGPNWIMVELENSRWGACTASVEFLANGNQLEGSPYFIPHGEQADPQLSPERLRTRFTDLAGETRDQNEFGVVPESDALCSRLIFMFRLY